MEKNIDAVRAAAAVSHDFTPTANVASQSLLLSSSSGYYRTEATCATRRAHYASLPHKFYSRAVKFRVLIHRSLPFLLFPPFRPSVRPSAEFINFFEGEFVDEVSEKADGASE